MWQEKHKTFSLPDQTTSPKRKRSYNYSNIRSPFGNNVDTSDGSSEIRKSAAINVSGARSECRGPWKLNPKKFSSHVGVNQRSKYEVGLEKTIAEQVHLRHQFSSSEHHCPEVWSNSNPNSDRSATNNLTGASVSSPALSVQHKETPSIVMTVGENVTELHQEAWASRNVAHRSLHLLESCNASGVAATSGTELQNLMRSRITSHAIKDTLQQELCSSSSEHLVSVEILSQSVRFNRSFEVSYNRSCSQKANKYETAYESKQSALCSTITGTSNLLSAGQLDNCEALQNEVQSCGSLLRGLPGKPYESKAHNTIRSQERSAAASAVENSKNTSMVDNLHMNGSRPEKDAENGQKIERSAAVPEMENSKSASMVDNLSKNGSRPEKDVEDGQKIVQHRVPTKADETIKSSSGKPSVTVGDMLWDGRVQLSSSVTVSAVAFYKSGEKFPGTNWSDFIEVKGKVRLEAFEKYVQDLPRSRNRGLMVISLCWKEGSSGTEFTGMKEVSNGYKKGKKVGYAQLLAGTDLYICPRSDTIITILAKYGFFKGVVAIEDNLDSLIGCVVWRKSQFSLNSITKTLDSKCKSSSEQPLATASGSGSLMLQVAEAKSYPAEPVQQANISAPLVTAVSYPSLVCVARNGDEIKKSESSKVQLEVFKSAPAATVRPTSLVPSSISGAQVGQKMSVPSLGTCQPLSGPLLEVEASDSAISAIDNSKSRLEEKNAIISVQPSLKKLSTPTFDEDDLPEYDFGIACGVSATVHGKHDASILDMKLPAKTSCEQDGSVSSTMGFVHTLSAPCQRLDDINVPKYHSAPFKGMPQPKVVLERACENLPNNNLEGQCGFQSKASPTPAASAFVPTKNSCAMVFDDDDDMPEWCPPEPYKQPLEETNKPRPTLAPKLPNFPFRNLSSVGPRPAILPPPPPSTHSHFSYQAFRPVGQLPPTVFSNSPRPVPIRSSSNFSFGFNNAPALRPQSSSLEVRPPYRLPGRTDWRPPH